MIRAVLFDFDDTLINYRASEKYGLTRALEEYGVQVKEEYLRLYGEINGAFWKMVERGDISATDLRVRRFEVLLEKTGITIDGTPAELCDRYLSHFSEADELEDGAMQALHWLHQQTGLKKAIITNGFHDTQRRRIAVTRIGGFFDALFISGEMGVKKPDAVMFERAMKELGIDVPDELLIVGDNLFSDIWGGKQAGLVTCWYNPLRQSPEEYRRFIDFEIEHLSQLPELPVFHHQEANKG